MALQTSLVVTVEQEHTSLLSLFSGPSCKSLFWRAKGNQRCDEKEAELPVLPQYASDAVFLCLLLQLQTAGAYSGASLSYICVSCCGWIQPMLSCTST